MCRGIPAVRNRVVQSGAKLVLEAIFEADLEPDAYGYRPKRSAHDAIQESTQTPLSPRARGVFDLMGAFVNCLLKWLDFR